MLVWLSVCTGQPALAGSLEPPVKNWRFLLEQIFTDCNAIATDNHQIGYTEKVLEIIVVLPRPFL